MSFFDSLVSDFLGPAAAILGGALFPEFAIPAEIAGGAAGGFAGGLIGGKSPGQAAVQGLETGAISGAVGAGADLLGGGSVSGILGQFGLGGAGDTAGAALPTGGVSGADAITRTPLPAMAPTANPTPPGAGASASLAGSISDAGSPAGGAFGDTGPLAGVTQGTAFDNPVGTPVGFSGGPSAGGTFSSAAGGGSGVSDFISKNWPALAGAGIIGYEALTNKQNLPQETALQQNATTAAGQAAALEAPLQTGILPPGAQQAVNAATAANKAGISSRFAQLGLSGSTMESEAIQTANNNAAAQTFQIANDLLAKGIDLSKLSAADLTTLIESQLKQDAAFTGALTGFAGSLADARTAA